MADQAAEQMQNMALHDYDSSEFDPLSPQNCKAGNFPYSDTQEVDLLGGTGAELTGVPNGHGKNVIFDDEALGLPNPAYVGQGQRARTEQFQRHMSTGEILGYQNEYGESGITGQMEYGIDSDDECDDNLVNFGGTHNGSSNYPGPPVDQAYLMSTGQPLVDFSNDLQTVPPVNEQQDLLGGDNFDDYSSPAQYQNLDDMGDKEYFDSVDPYYAQGPVENDYPEDDIDPNNWQPEVDAERSRRSLSPERSMSPRQEYSQSEGAEGVMSPQCDTESYDNLDSVDESSYSESQPVPLESVQESVIPQYDEEHSDRSHVDYSETDSVTSDASGVQKFRSGVPRLRKIKKPKALPPWNDNVVIPKKPKPRPTFIGNKEYLPTASSSPDRPQTAPVHFVAKDASSDSGVEEDKATKTSKDSVDSKKYGTDSKNDKYKPGGGQIQIFSQKLDTKHVSPRTDTKIPKSALTPRSPVKSPPPARATTPNTRHVQSKIGSLNNVKHSPGGGNIAILSTKPDFSNVKSKVGSKDKIDHKPKGGDKKIENRKLDWKVESKVGSLKNSTHSPGGGNIKDGTVQVKGTLNTRENVGYTPGGGHVPEPWEEDLEWEADAQINSLDNLDYVPGGGKVRDGTVQVKGTLNTRENVGYTPGGGHVPEPWEEDLEWEADAQINSLDNLDYVPGGGKVRIFSERLSWNAEAKVDTGLQRKSDSLITKATENRYDSARQQVAVVIEPYPDSAKPDLQGDSIDNDVTDGSAKPSDSENILSKEVDIKTPPPKPPRCIHKQWEIEYLKKKKQNDEEDSDASTEPDTYGTNFELSYEVTTANKHNESDGIPKEKIDEENDSVELLGFKKRIDVDGPVLTKTENNDDTGIHVVGSAQSSKLKNSGNFDKELSLRGDADSIKKVMVDITNGEERRNQSLDRKETHIEMEPVVSVEKENKYDNGTTSKKTSLGSKFIDMITPKKKVKNGKSTVEPRSRFSSTSKDINRRNSKKGHEKGVVKDNDEKTVMAKYLGYVSPKLLKKDIVTIVNGKDEPKVAAKASGVKKQSSFKKHSETEEQVEKLANLGYESPKLAKRAKDVVLTGARKSQTETQNQSGMKKGLVKRMAEKFSRNSALKPASVGIDKTSRGSFKGGVHGDYQEIDLVAKARLTGSYKINENGDDGNGVSNPGFDYDMDSDVDTDEERVVSYAKIMINQGPKNVTQPPALQTTTFKFKSDRRPNSPYNEIKQELIEAPKKRPDYSSSENVAMKLLDENIGLNVDESSTPRHDAFGYSLIDKSKVKVTPETKTSNQDTTVETNDVKPKYFEKMDASKLEMKIHVSRESASNVIYEFKGEKSSSDTEDEKCLSLDEELKQALSGIGDIDRKLLKSPPQNEGTVLGSRPGTPKISVKPIRLKAEEEARGLSYSSSFSVRGMDDSQKTGFDRSQRCQSMILRKQPRYDTSLENQGGKLLRVSAQLLHSEETVANKTIEERYLTGVGEVMEEHETEKFDYKSVKVIPQNSGIKLSDDALSNGSLSDSMVTVGIGDIRYGFSDEADISTYPGSVTKGKIPRGSIDVHALKSIYVQDLQRKCGGVQEIKLLQVNGASCKENSHDMQLRMASTSENNTEEFYSRERKQLFLPVICHTA